MILRVSKGVCTILITLSEFLFAGCSNTFDNSDSKGIHPDEQGVFHVYPGESIQNALDAAAAHDKAHVVRVHAGTYSPERQGQAFIWFNRRHDGILLEAEGNVTLTAQNPEIADPKAETFPAIVNHIVYFGDGISNQTRIRGFHLTGANRYVTKSEEYPIEPKSSLPKLKKAEFFYGDGGAIKIFGRSYPVIKEMLITDNDTSPCGGGISIEHRGFNKNAPLIENCIFRNNRCRVTGSAVDVLPASAAVIRNCLFVENNSNSGKDLVSLHSEKQYNAEHGSGALTVFSRCVVTVEQCTFTGNWNGVDDKAVGSIYKNCLFWKNDKTGGISPLGRYEFDISDGRKVSGCFLGGSETLDLRDALDHNRNSLNCSDPEFDSNFVPTVGEFVSVGYRPTPALLKMVATHESK